VVRIYFVIILLGIFISNLCQGADTEMKLLLPKEIHGWKASSKDQLYDQKTIYDYIDGGGEVYLAFNFHQVLVRRYVKPRQPAIIAELFDMGRGEEAFGVFSFEREGDEIGIGQDSEYVGGLLRFWQDRFFVCLSMEEETPQVRQAVMDLGRVIVKRIKSEGKRPELLSLLPLEDLIFKTVRYFHQQFCLNHHYPVSEKNIFNLDLDTEAVLAQYQVADSKTNLLLVRYPNQERAKSSFLSFVRAYMPKAGELGIVQTENGKWTKIELNERLIMVVFDASTKARAEALVEAVRKKLDAIAQCKMK